MNLSGDGLCYKILITNYSVDRHYTIFMHSLLRPDTYQEDTYQKKSCT